MPWPNMSRSTYEIETAVVRTHTDAALRSFLPDPSYFNHNHQRFMIVINGMGLYDKETRSSVAACRNALRRKLRRYLTNHVFYNQARIPTMGWVAFRRYLRVPVNTVIEELEKSGVVEYRAATLVPTTSVGIVG